MINHARTLLLNKTQTDANCSWGEYIPGDFVPTNLPTHLLAAWHIFYGASPDAWMLNWRVHQFMGILQCSDFGAYVVEMDNRISYDILKPITDDLPRIAVKASKVGNAVRTTGMPVDDPVAGRLGSVWRVAIDGGYMRVSRESDGMVRVEPIVSAGDGYTSPVDLDTGMTFCAKEEFEEGDGWIVDMLARPSRGIQDVMAGLMTLPYEYVNRLFASSEPYATFEKLWRDNRAWTLKLSGFLLAWIYRHEEFRGG
jgi:hypothetical protein